MVGKEAVQAAALEPERVADLVKRDMGAKAYHKKLNGQDMPPEVISSFVLRSLKADAERKLGPVSRAVITVPAYFDEPRRRATMDACRLAGLEVLDILNELRVMLRMLVDPRYRLTWPARIVPIVAIVLILLSDYEKLAFLFPWNFAPGLGYYLNKVFHLVLAFIMFKVLEREVDRYREKVPDAPRPLRNRE